MWQRIVTAIAVCLVASCVRSIKKDEDIAADNTLGAYAQPKTRAANPNLEQLRDTMRAFSDSGTRLDNGTLSVTLDAFAQALHGVPYADLEDDASEVHRIAEVLRMGPNTTHRTEIVRDGLKAAVAGLENASLDARYGAQRSMIATLAQQVETLDPQRPVNHQTLQVKLAFCNMANAIAGMPGDSVSTLPCTTLPTASAARDISTERLSR